MSWLDRIYEWKLSRLYRQYQIAEDVQKNGHRYRSLVREFTQVDSSDRQHIEDLQREAKRNA